MTIWRPSLRRPDRPASPREADVEMGIALILMIAGIVLTSLIVPGL